MTKNIRERSYLKHLDTSDEEVVLYTCPDNCRTKMQMLFLTNAGGTVNVYAYWYRAEDNATYFILGGKNLSSSDFVLLWEDYIVLEAGDRLSVKAVGTGVDVSAICTAEEIFKPVG